METAKHSSANGLIVRLAIIGEQIVRVCRMAMVCAVNDAQAIVALPEEYVVAERELSIEERLQRLGRIRYR